MRTSDWNDPRLREIGAKFADRKKKS